MNCFLVFYSKVFDVFDEMSRRNLVSRAATVFGLVRHGLGMFVSMDHG